MQIHVHAIRPYEFHIDAMHTAKLYVHGSVASLKIDADEFNVSAYADGLNVSMFRAHRCRWMFAQ